jgi:mRNA interferase RelE/StbE
MKLDYTKTALGTLETLPAAIRKAFYKQAGFLVENLHHPSLRAKKYDEAEDKWQARVNRSWRFYFKIVGDTYIIQDITPHPKK